MKRASTMPHSTLRVRRKSVAVLTKFMSNAEVRTGMSSTIGYKQNRRWSPWYEDKNHGS
jgi:hypothetical protein